MKVKFTCGKCNESFNVNGENFKNKTNLVCPNCGSEFPEDKLKTLGEAVLKIQEIQRSLSVEDELGAITNSWDISFADSKPGLFH